MHSIICHACIDGTRIRVQIYKDSTGCDINLSSSDPEVWNAGLISPSRPSLV
ncbi:hypothetical protein P3T22_004888 [Paraburkholderia sp. GAS348]